MKKTLIKLLSSTLLVCSVFVVSPISAHAEWRQDSTGWWYTEGSSWATGWRQIDGEWYCFDNNGYAYTGLQAINGKDYYFDIDNCNMLHDQYVAIGRGNHAPMAWAESDGHINYNKKATRDFNVVHPMQ